MGLPYSFRVYRDDADEGPYWAAEVIELKGCAGDGATADEAIASAKEHMASWLASAVSRGLEIPEPGRTKSGFSGKFVLRTTKSLHADLARRAEREGVSMNTWCVTVLAQHGT